MKHICLLGILILAVSCNGGKDGGNNSGSDSSPIEDGSVKNCSVKFSRKDSLETLAIKANQARSECGLSEEETLILLKK